MLTWMYGQISCFAEMLNSPGFWRTSATHKRHACTATTVPTSTSSCDCSGSRCPSSPRHITAARPIERPRRQRSPGPGRRRRRHITRTTPTNTTLCTRSRTVSTSPASRCSAFLWSRYVSFFPTNRTEPVVQGTTHLARSPLQRAWQI